MNEKSDVATMGDQIERLTMEAAGKLVTIGGEDFSQLQLYRPPPTPREDIPATLDFATLLSFAEYITAYPDEDFLDEHGTTFVHVESPTSVRLVTSIFGGRNQRAVVARATAIVPQVPLDEYQTVEDFVIGLQALYVENATRADVLKLVGNLKDETVGEVMDDGKTQVVKARVGVVSIAEVEIQNPVRLAPYRTFGEVSQPESDFVLRVKGGGPGRLPNVALFLADGGLWRLPAIDAVKAWLVAYFSEHDVSLGVYG